MVTAKFHAIGNTSHWFRTRIQEEINATGVEGSPIEVDQNKLAIIVEGSKGNIERLYNNLREASPEDVGFTKIIFDESQPKRWKTSPQTTNDVAEILGEIEKNMRRINQKLDVLLARSGLNADSTASWNTTKKYEEKDEDNPEDETISSFFNMQ